MFMSDIFLAHRFACVSVNRLTLHLRSYASNYGDDFENTAEHAVSEFAARRRNSWLGASTFEVSVDGGGGGELSLGILELRDMSNDGELNHELRN